MTALPGVGWRAALDPVKTNKPSAFKNLAANEAAITEELTLCFQVNSQFSEKSIKMNTNCVHDGQAGGTMGSKCLPFDDALPPDQPPATQIIASNELKFLEIVIWSMMDRSCQNMLLSNIRVKFEQVCVLLT